MGRIMQGSVLLFVFVALTAVLVEARRVNIESEDSLPLPLGWRRISRQPVINSNRVIKLIFALKQRNLDILEETFWAVSDPQNPRYGQHLSLQELGYMLSPSEHDVKIVTDWLEEHGVKKMKLTPIRDFLQAETTVKIATELFGVDFYNFRHRSGASIDTSLGPYSLPEMIAKHVDIVTGVVGFPDVEERTTVRKNPFPDRENKSITPIVIRTRYNVSSTLICTNANSSHAVAEFQAQYYDPSDLKQFWDTYVPFAPYRPIDKVFGTNIKDKPSLEASLDTQYIMGVAPNATTFFYSQKAFDFWSDLVAWQTLLASQTEIPFVHSISYGSQGDYPSDSYRARLNTDFQKMGTRGASVLFASGDDGSACTPLGQAAAFGASGKACDCEFYPSFPATCPYVTSIGATRFINGNSGPEAAVYLFLSGGGFSQYFPTQTWQSAAVKAYFASGVKMPESCAYNASGRGTPDAAALGDEYFQVIDGGQLTPVGGTSASTPTFAGIITLLNDQRFNAGKAALGYLNTWIYQTAASSPSAFYDVTVGDNSVPSCCSAGQGGFNCAKGWDPVTGVGTPNFAELSTLV
jgi:tripeptidyl-peptidase-1